MEAARQFDFWLGEWGCSWEGGYGTNTVTSELDGAVILERFDGRPGSELRGISVSVYDDELKSWRQTWVDSTQAYLEFSGAESDGEMVLRRTAKENGAIVRYRMRFTEIAETSLVWLWERRHDGSGGWDVLWRIDYTRRA
jgi:hypothetical protein